MTEKELLAAGWTKKAENIWVMPGIGAVMNQQCALAILKGKSKK